jgi:hypothetical protein
MGVLGLPAGTVAEIGPEGTGIAIRQGDRLVTSAAYHPVPERVPASDGVYELFFFYTGPGSNACGWPTDDQRWRCSGGY